MVGKIICSSGEASDAKRRYEPPKKSLKDDPIILSDSEEVEDTLSFKEGEPLPAWFTSEEDYKKEREEMLKYEATKKKLKGDSEDMDFKMSYASMNEKDYQDFDDDEDEDPKTPPHYHSDEFYEDSLSEE
ncbi:hypothetical protein FNV43_RR11169 [Rhamnella rubrinervis]|uniref:Uncharacterized protein n=1 Tax=Rhamnella rubrinervis TaxID=2594499 RepID=A0A8K0H5B4_9ROSA|nr:hypothetical protein FNV43_RR11169 [Rhamnella rubrinervis]